MEGQSCVSTSGDWEIGCSDEENTDLEWDESLLCYLPKKGTIIQLYEELDKNDGPFAIKWEAGERRAPTPEMPVEESPDTPPPNPQESQEKDEYLDFEVDKGQVRLRPSGDVGPRGSAKKKTTSLDAILSNMARHRRMDMMEQDPPE